MLEVEMKFPVTDWDAVLHRLESHGAQALPPRHDADHYFNAPDRDFAKTDEALRLRSIGSLNLITYKGAKRDVQSKTRTEIEVPLGDGPEAAANLVRLLEHLGYRPVAVVRKQRCIYRLTWEGYTVEVCLDVVEELGSFGEIEIQAAEDDWEPARDALLRLAADLGLTGSERRSYLELLLQLRGM